MPDQPRFVLRRFGLVVMVIGLAGCNDSTPPAGAASPPTRTIRVLTYNVQLLPLDWLNKRPDHVYRAGELGKRLAEYDLVGLSEVFQPQRRADVIDALRAAWQPEFHLATAPDTARTPWGLDGGLVLVGKLPITESHWLAYGNGSSVAEHGLEADGFANKGVLHVRLARKAFAGDDAELDLFLTHLESRESARRDDQYAMLGEFIGRHAAPDRPIMLLGDLNTDGGRKSMDNPSSQYHRLMGKLKAVRPQWIDVGATIDPDAWGTMPADETDRAHRIDYIFVANPDSGSGLKVREARVERFADSRVKFLSDHAAVAATLEW